MFTNIGSKIKTVAAIIAWVGIIGSVVSGFAMIATGSDEMILIGIVTAVVGSLLSWVGSFFAYGFGQLIENSDKLVQLQGGNPGAGYAPYTPQYNGVNAQQPMYGNGMYGVPGANQNQYYNGNNQQ